MPAINPARLKQQVAELDELYTRPELFVRAVRQLMDYYTDRTLRPGNNSSRVSLLPHYQIPNPVMRQIQAAVQRLSKKEGTPASICLADALWKEGYYETRLMAIDLLEQVGISQPEALKVRLLAWISPKEDSRLVQALLATGQNCLGDEWFVLAKSWLTSDTLAEQILGIRALTSLVKDAEFQNLPAVFSLLIPQLDQVPAVLHPHLADLITHLADRSQAETLYYLRRAVIVSHDPLITRLVRRCLPAFTAENQQLLREVLLSRAHSNLV